MVCQINQMVFMCILYLMHWPTYKPGPPSASLRRHGIIIRNMFFLRAILLKNCQSGIIIYIHFLHSVLLQCAWSTRRLALSVMSQFFVYRPLLKFPCLQGVLYTYSVKCVNLCKRIKLSFFSSLKYGHSCPFDFSSCMYHLEWVLEWHWMLFL